MTTTDPTPLAERAARERREEDSWLMEIYRAALRQLGADPDEIDAAFREGLNTPPEELGATVSPVYLTNGAADA